MAPSHTPDHEQIRAAVTARYSGLARAAHAGSRSPTAILAPSLRDASAPPGTPTPASCRMARCGPASAAATR